jgi:hypothetical protein
LIVVFENEVSLHCLSFPPALRHITLVMKGRFVPWNRF